ncbi:Uncharacterised protein [Streptococcus pyogenes]|nr:Uncharacterised protein [Streptococcus pyogenes]VGR98681.1 Uncharacterised protein [Streptococcus pyogenes]VGS60813.1 Uncharacterised protein [Streptococcus pyogenes]VGW25186.1 Uncharacterised protein [Streptococcus pyogenes]VGW25431.1 Uncharacterised protein [Streptococcus pyogenes]
MYCLQKVGHYILNTELSPFIPIVKHIKVLTEKMF